MTKLNPSADRFFTLLQKSGLADEEQIAAARAARPQADAAGVARYLVEQGVLTSWQARKLQAGQHALHLGKYKLLDRLPWGDTGRVYLAEHTQMRSRVAIKTLDRALAEDPEAIKRFQKEGGVAARLDHPHIIHVRDFDCESNYYFLVLEYVEGEGLDQRIGRDGPLPPDKAADLLAQAASGLAHAHEQGVVHRDLQPVKLLLTADGGVKILDLGAADLAQLEADGESSANPYAAPEALQTPAAADARSDLYSLGAIFYFMLNGQAPPAAVEGVKSSARRRRPNLPDELVEICDKLLKTDPCDRYADAGEVVDALQAWLEQNRRKAPEPPAPPRSERPVLKTRDTSASDSNKPASGDFELAVKKPSAAARVRTGGRPQPRGGVKPTKPPAESTELEVVETPWWKNLKIVIPAALGAVVVCAVFGVALAVIMDDGQPTSTQVAKGDKDAGKDSEKSSKGDPSGKADAAKKPKGGGTDFKFPQPSEIVREQTAQEKAKEKAEQEEADRIARLKAAAAEAVKPKADKPPEKPPEKTPEPAGPPKTPFATVPVEVVRVSAPGGVTLERLVEDPVSYLATGESPASARYEIVVKTDAAKITGICLQVLAHEQLPKSGPGRGGAGDFQLEQVRLSASDSDVFVSTDEVPLVSAEADVTSPNAPIAGALDPDAAKFWSVAPQIGKNHWAVFRAKQPLERTGTTYLQILLDHGPAAIGRFRVWAVTGEAPADKTLFANTPIASPPVWNPLGGLVSQISLPALGGGPETLGDLAQDQTVVAYLLGGGKASPRRSFSMSETAPKNWEIVLHETTAPQGPGVVVAKVTHADGRLALQWTPAAKEQSEAAWLANCILQFELGAKSHKIVLRTPIETESLALNFKSGRALARVEIPQLPDPAGIKFLFDQQAEGFPPHQFDPAPQLAFDAGATVMKVGAEEKLVQFQIKSKGSPRGAELNLTANLAFAADAKPMLLNKSSLSKAEMSIGGALQQMTGLGMQLDQAIKQAGGNQGLKKQLETQKATLDQRMLEAQAANQKLDGLKALLATLSSVGGVTYRVVYQVDDQTIELARSLPPTPQEVEQPQGLNLGQ